MRTTPTHLVWLLVLGVAIFAPTDLMAQPSDITQRANIEDGRKSGTYLKLGLARWQGDISSRSVFTDWNVDLFGTDVDLTSANVQIESYFGDTFLQLSGFTIGYRKDALRFVDSGHMLNGALFRDIDLTVVALKVSGGVEWGMPALTFDTSAFEFLADGTVRYRHIHPHRNADVPLVGTTTDGAVYPFAEVSIVQRPWIFLVEAGMRFNFIGFNFDDYEVSPTDEITQVFTRKTETVPYLFVNLGLRLF